MTLPHVGQRLAVGCPAELGAKDGGERCDGHQKIVTCGQPLASVRREATTCDAMVHRRMVAEVARPGVQHGKEPERTADKAAVRGECLPGGCRGAGEEAVEGVLVAAGKVSHRGRPGKGHHTIGDGGKRGGVTGNGGVKRTQEPSGQ